MTQSIGVIGLGVMGSAMAANLLKAGFTVEGYDIAPKARAALKRIGGRPVASISRIKAPVVITSLPSAQALHDVVAAFKTRCIVLETSTLPIEEKERARASLARKGITLLDCPLSGTGAQARAKDLVVFASGERGAFRKAAPFLPGFSRAHYYLGAFGNGSRMKFVANLLVAINNVASAEAMVLAEKAGLDLRQVVKLVGAGAAQSRIFDLRAPMMADNHYLPATMRLSTWQKDMAVIGAFASALGSPTPLFRATIPIYDAANGMDLGDFDVAAVLSVFETMSGVRRG